MLELNAVSKAFGALRPLRIERLAVGAGEAVAVLGLDRPAAAVLVDLIMGTTLPDTGQIDVFGRPTSAIADSTEWLALTDRVGMVSARAVLLDSLSVVQNLAVPFTLEIEPPPPAVRERAVALARLVNLGEATWDAPVASLDGAGRARLHLARALAHDPELLLVEHATAGVGPAESAELGALASTVALERRTAILALTTDDIFARAVARRVLRHDPRTGRLSDARGWSLWPKRRT